VVLGASNVRIGISVAIAAAQQALASPLDVMAAIGFGRSYGIRSWVLGRSLEGILECGLWEDLRQRPALPTTGVLTDIGNDILYDVPVERIATWVESCVDRLSKCTEHLVLTSLPLENIEKLGRCRFVMMRTILFPKCRLDLTATVKRAKALNERILDVASERQVSVVHAHPQWYGFDPIHIRKRHREAVWKKIFGSPAKKFSDSFVRLPWSDRIHLQRLRPMRRRLFGWDQEATQPSGILSNGTLVSLY
jgi:hypothetical protein